MKAILLIDVPDNTDFDKDYRLTGLLLANEYAENVGIEFKDARLKPMPEKKNTDSSLKYTNEPMQYRREGYNQCIDEILGEEE